MACLLGALTRLGKIWHERPEHLVWRRADKVRCKSRIESCERGGDERTTNGHAWWRMYFGRRAPFQLYLVRRVSPKEYAVPDELVTFGWTVGARSSHDRGAGAAPDVRPEPGLKSSASSHQLGCRWSTETILYSHEIVSRSELNGGHRNSCAFTPHAAWWTGSKSKTCQPQRRLTGGQGALRSVLGSEDRQCKYEAILR